MVQEQEDVHMLYHCFRHPTWRKHEPVRLSTSLNHHSHPRPKEILLNKLAQADLAAAVILRKQPGQWPQGSSSRRQQRLPGYSVGDSDLLRACRLEQWPRSPRSPFDGLVQDRTRPLAPSRSSAVTKLSVVAQRGSMAAHRTHIILPGHLLL